MKDVIGAFKSIRDAISGVASAAVLKERLAFLQDRFRLMEEENAALKEENACLRQQCVDAANKAHAQAEAEQYTKHRGALFRLDPGHGYEHVVYCPRCRISTVAWPDDSEVFSCTTCEWASSFRGVDLPGIVAELNARPR